jgi:cysteine desulfurase/selenocysteine lyase
MGLDVERARQDTPGCLTVAHLNNAGASLQPSAVTNAVIAHLQLESTMGGYEAAARAAANVENTYAAVARLLSCATNEIALVENATRAWDMAFYSMTFAPGDRILTTSAEYASNAIALLHVAQRTGAQVEVLDDDEHGQLDIADLARRLDHSVKLVAVTHVPTHGGLVNPAAEVGKLTRAAGVPFLLDACQSVGQLPINVAEIGCDLLSATGRKFLRGPRGTGFLYVATSLAEKLQPPFLDLHSATWTAPYRYTIAPGARRFETWEGNVAAKIGLGVAVDYALGVGLEAIERRVTELSELLRTRLSEHDGVTVQDHGETL